MSSPPIPIPHTALLCSFCSKPEPAVQWLVAGPGGVYICNECVTMSAKIISESGTEESARSRADYLDPSVDIVLTRIGELVRTSDRIENQLVSSVNRLRERGTDWTAIAAAAGIGAESIQARLERAQHPASQ